MVCLYLWFAVLRVYDRFSVIEQPQMRMTGLRRLHSITGTRTKNWPIKSTLFQGHDCKNSYCQKGFGVLGVDWARSQPNLTAYLGSECIGDDARFGLSKWMPGWLLGLQEQSLCGKCIIVGPSDVEHSKVVHQCSAYLLHWFTCSSDWQSVRKRWPRELDGLPTNGGSRLRTTDTP